MRRHALGIISILMLVAGGFALFYFGVDDSQSSMAASICLRAGLVLGAIWLAFPQILQVLARVPPWLVACILLSVMAVIARPKTIILVAPLLAALAVMQFVTWLFKPLPQPKRSQRRRQTTQKGQDHKSL
jgi:hypothetical protein